MPSARYAAITVASSAGREPPATPRAPHAEQVGVAGLVADAPASPARTGPTAGTRPPRPSRRRPRRSSTSGRTCCAPAPTPAPCAARCPSGRRTPRCARAAPARPAPRVHGTMRSPSGTSTGGQLDVQRAPHLRVEPAGVNPPARSSRTVASASSSVNDREPGRELLARRGEQLPAARRPPTRAPARPIPRPRHCGSTPPSRKARTTRASPGGWFDARVGADARRRRRRPRACRARGPSSRRRTPRRSPPRRSGTARRRPPRPPRAAG